MESKRTSETYSSLHTSYVKEVMFKLGQAGSFATLWSHAPCRDALAELNAVCEITLWATLHTHETHGKYFLLQDMWTGFNSVKARGEIAFLQLF